MHPTPSSQPSDAGLSTSALNSVMPACVSHVSHETIASTCRVEFFKIYLPLLLPTPYECPAEDEPLVKQLKIAEDEPLAKQSNPVCCTGVKSAKLKLM